MDKQIVQALGADAYCYKWRTDRQKKRTRYKDFDQQLRALGREQHLLWKKKQNLGWEPLEPPVQKGWKRKFVLRDDVAKSKQADFFQGILNKVNTTDWSYRKDFKVRRRRFGKKIYVVKPQLLLQPCSMYAGRVKFSAEEAFYFDELMIQHKGRIEKRYVFKEPWRFVLKVMPNIIDKVRIKDGELESRLDEIDNYLERNGYKYRFQRVVYGRGKYRNYYWIKPQEQNPLLNLPLLGLLDGLKSELL